MINSKGITLASLAIYVIVMLMVIGVISSISIIFYNNAESLDEESKDLIEFTNFNDYFIKEVKMPNNKVNQIDEKGQYIIFETGDSFSLKEDKMFFNNLEISKNVKNVNFAFYRGENGIVDQSVITVTIEFQNYSKTINYKVEEIY